ncbi:MAG: phosphopantetheine-binding protein [Burkholderiaceae bacterium]
MKDLREKILTALRDTADQRDTALIADFNDDTVLLESGIDSLGFAILVTRLEEDLGYDPFVLMDEPVYPRTFGDFLAIYERYQPVN